VGEYARGRIRTSSSDKVRKCAPFNREHLVQTQAIIDVLKGLKDSGTAFLLISHQKPFVDMLGL
jgi:hypothetical protein